MFAPYKHQIDGAIFLAERKTALLADQPRVGKTGAAIMAADYEMAKTICVVTTASGRAVWQRAFKDWSTFGRKIQVLDKGTDLLDLDTNVQIVSWNGVSSPKIRAQLMRRKWDRVILDESHYAKSPDTRRTQAVFGLFEGPRHIAASATLFALCEGRMWCLTGTPLPNSPADAYPMLRALRPACLRADGDLPDVTTFDAYMRRYCIVKMKKISNFRSIPVVIGGRNLPELRARIGDFMLLRTQADVGIRPPVQTLFPIGISETVRRQVDAHLQTAEILRAADAGDTKALEMQLGPIRRLTGDIKARAVVEAVKEEFECGLDKIVLAYWHTEVGRILKEGLSSFGVVGIDGSTSTRGRGEAEQRFLSDPSIRVFLGQIAAAGEAIDLSSSANLMFVETVFQPAQMRQMSLRVTNTGQRRNVLVRVATLAGSIDEALQEILLRKWTAINEVLGK
jgi:SWI/SNF-related matrix-associated actin-dependent regulator of chromatin subfamily A-like protein 1